jgi:hypothetical protein
MMVGMAIVALIALAFVVWLALELRYRDIHLAWINERDGEIANLYKAAMKLTLIPKNNPLSAFKEHGMIAANAVRIEVVVALDERLEALSGATNGIVHVAHTLEDWERAHPAPPSTLGEALQRRWGRFQGDDIKPSTVVPETSMGKMLRETKQIEPPS